MYSYLSPLLRSRHGRRPHLLSLASFLPQLPRLSHTVSSDDDQLRGSRLGFVRRELEEIRSLQPVGDTRRKHPERREAAGWTEEAGVEEVEISHRWPEWVGLMERLLRSGYLDRYGLRRGSPTVSKDANRIRTACLSYARDRVDLIRYLSRKDIQVIVEFGCPSSDRKVSNSGKRLRAHLGIEEGKVCSSCILRGKCDRAYLNARKGEHGRTVDVMRILLTYGIDLAIGPLDKKSCLLKAVEDSARLLLHELVVLSIREVNSDSDSEDMTSDYDRLSRNTRRFERKQLPSQIGSLMKQGDWICPKCNFLNFAKNIKCLHCDSLSQEKIKTLKEEYEHLPLKKGDWICDKCNFLNFAKNVKCLQCNGKPLNRQLNPGEWECPSCNYINFRRNAICLKCDWKRPKAENVLGSSASTRFQSDDLAHDRHPRISFVRDESGSDVQHLPHMERREDSDFWFTSDDEEDNMTNMPVGLVDFQPTGGFKKREKAEMTGTGMVQSKQIAGSDRTVGSIRSGFHNQYFSEDDMEEWFGHRRKDNNVI